MSKIPQNASKRKKTAVLDAILCFIEAFTLPCFLPMQKSPLSLLRIGQEPTVA